MLQTEISTNTVRLIASQYINTDTPPKVNYEKVLSFISGSLKEANAVRPTEVDPPRLVRCLEFEQTRLDACPDK